jgi:signal transduction histidine kinase
MASKRWWHVGVVSTAVVLSALLPVGATGLPLVVGLACTAGFVLFWFLIGQRFSSSDGAAVAFTIIVVLFCGTLAAIIPYLAIAQALAYPLVWWLSRSFRMAVIANIALAVSVGVGQYFSSGADAPALIQALVIQTISLGFSFFIGTWITRVENRSDDRRRLLEELQAAQAELATLNRDAGITSERERLAREIHDTIAQDLTGLVLLAQRVSRELSAGNTAAVGEQLALLEEGARTALAETRALVASTAPPALEAGGIAAALDRLADRYQRETAIEVTNRSDVETALDRDLEVVLLRCAQEGLANVRKHSGATKAAITLVARTSELSLQISDNGSGFDLADHSSGYGLSGMRERLALVGGTLDVESGEDGTTLLVTLPAGGIE